MRQNLPFSRKRRSTATGASGIGIDKFEASAVQAAHIVDGRAIHVLLANRINEQPDAALFDNRVIFPRAVIKAKIVLKARATTANDGDAETAVFQPFSVNDFFDFFDRDISQKQCRPLRGLYHDFFFMQFVFVRSVRHSVLLASNRTSFRDKVLPPESQSLSPYCSSMLHKAVSLEKQIQSQATALGFTLCGFTRLSPLPREQFFSNWLAQGHAGEMAYLAREPQRRIDPAIPFPEAKSVICLGYPYAPPRVPEIDWRSELRGRIAAYAAGGDYHDTIQAKLKILVAHLQEATPGLRARTYVDTGPLFEREWAYRSGLGWFGKNTMLLHKGAGSWFFLAEILVSVDLEGEGIPQAHCGKCTRCLTDCPTGALEEGYVLKAPLCISYLTIEHRGLIPHELRPKMGNWIFGCDVCQEVCPWNEKFAHPQDDLVEELFPSLTELMVLDEAGFRARFSRSAIRRTKRRGLLRNVAIALGNSGNPEAIPSLQTALHDPEPLVRSHAAWALGQFVEVSAREALSRHRDREADAEVHAEVTLALEH